MIAELAAFNAAFAVVKTAVSHGKDIASCAKSIGEMIGAQEALQVRGEQKKNSVWSALAGKDTNDFEEFMALEQIKEQRKELLQAMQLYGRAGLKDDFLRFEGEARKARRQAAASSKARKEKLTEYVLIFTLLVATVCVLGFILYAIAVKKGYL